MKWVRIFKTLFWVQVGVNLVGALGPELGFDALWYHLPESRMIVERGWWGIIPGGLLYTTGLPRLMEFVNAGLLGIGKLAAMNSPEILPKLFSWLMGILVARMIVKIGKKMHGEKVGWVAASLWYTTLVVGWQSLTVYVDLHRTLVTMWAIWLLLEERWVWSAVLMGLAYSIKNFAGVDAIFIAIYWSYMQEDWKAGIKYLLVFAPIPIMWAISNVLQGYAMFYPMGGYYGLGEHYGGGVKYFLGPIYEMLNPSNRVGPVILIIFILGWKDWRKMASSKLGLLTLGLIIAWFFVPRSWDGRYFLPAMALLSIVAAWVWTDMELKTKRVVGVLIFLQILVGVMYRTLANARFVPLLIGAESRGEFLARRLDLGGSDWYDVDGWVSNNLKNERYLVIGIHNTYYLPGTKWDHESWRDKSFCYQYVLVKGSIEMDEEYEMLHNVEKSKSKIYKDRKCG